MTYTGHMTKNIAIAYFILFFDQQIVKHKTFNNRQNLTNSNYSDGLGFSVYNRENAVV